MLTLALVRAARPRVADPAPRRRPRAARGRAGADLRGDRGRRRPRLPRLVHHPRGTRSHPRAAVIRRLRDYYRQFEELSPEEISAELRERRDAERASALTEVHPLDLATPAWHEPPDAEAVNAATYALRRAVNAYPDDDALRRGAGRPPRRRAADQVAPGHGAGELLHAAFGAIAAGGRVAIAWPGWSPLPGLVHEAGGTPVPVPLTDDGAPGHRGARRGRAGHQRGRALHARTTRPARRRPTCATWPSGSPSRSGWSSTPRSPSSRPTRTSPPCSPRASACCRPLVLQGARDGRPARRLRARQRRRPARPAEPGRRRLGARPGRDAVGGPRGRAGGRPPPRRRRPRARAARRRPARQPVLLPRRPRPPRLAHLDRGGRRRARAPARRRSGST